MAAALLAAGVACPAAPSAATGPRAGQDTGREAEARVVELRVREATVDGSVLIVTSPGHRTVTLAAEALFDGDASDMHADGRGLVDDVAGDLEERGGRRVAVEAHAPGRGTLELTEERATDVQYHLDYLLDESFTIEATGYGDARPVADAGDPDAAALNDRIVISYSLD